MKNILKVTILFCLIIGLFVVPSFADNSIVLHEAPVFDSRPTRGELKTNGEVAATSVNDSTDKYYYGSDHSQTFCLHVQSTDIIYLVSPLSNVTGYFNNINNSTNLNLNTPERTLSQVFTGEDVYYFAGITVNNNYILNVPSYSTISDACDAISDYIDNPPAPTPTYSKNVNVDEFIANTMISMGVKFDTPAYAISYAADAWDWCIDETNMESANPFDEWNIESFVSYCNAQSNNYLNWYNGYKVSKDVTNALGEYIRQNIRSLTGLPAGVTSLTGAYLPIYHYGSGFNSGASSPTAQTFYPAQTITYFNGEYVNETDNISTSQFLYTPADVRRFLGYPGTSPVITPSSPTGTGTITDDPNNPGQKNITINFPSLDWLADAIKSILDFLRDAFTTLANLLTQLLDAILGLFSDAFESLQDFGQGIIDFIQSVFSGLSDLLSGYVPSDISVIIVTFIALNFGIGLITFVLKGH